MRKKAGGSGVSIFRRKRSLAVLAVFFAVLAGFSNLVFAYTVREIIDYADDKTNAAPYSILARCSVFLLATICVNWLKQYTGARLIRSVSLDLKNRLFQTAFGRRAGSTDYVSVLSHDVQTINAEYYLPFMDLAMYISMFVFAAGVLFDYSWLHGTVMAATAGLSVFVSFMQKKNLAQKRIQVSQNQEIYTAKIRDMFYGLSIVRLFQALKQVSAEHQNENCRIEQSKFIYSVRIAGLDALSTLISMFMFMFSFVLGALFVRRGIYTLGMMLSAIQLVNNLVIPMRGSVQSLNLIHGSQAVLRKIKTLLSANDNCRPAAESAKPLDIQTIELRNLSFNYDRQEILHSISFCFRQGRKYAIVGESGCGKTTLLNLISRQLDCRPGHLLINDDEIENIPSESLLSVMAFMNQTVFVFNDSIAQNITLFEDLTGEQIQDAIHAAGLQPYVDSLPQGIHHVVENNGDNLSGGQKQRIALARVLIRNAQVVLLDEAFSAVDPVTSDEIIRNLIQKNMMLIAVTHQYNQNLLRLFDEILVIRHGRLIESGHYDSLIVADGYFCSLIRFDGKQ